MKRLPVAFLATWSLTAVMLTAADAGGTEAPLMTRYDLDSGIGETVLENGLRILTLERHNAPIVSCQIWYRVGSADEPVGQTGMAHFLEHLMFKGTDRYGRGEIDRLTLKLGGSNNAATYKDYTYYYFNFASDRWVTALDVEANRMRNVRFDPAEFAAERKVVIEELQIGRDGPWGELDESIEAVSYLAHPYRHPVIGWREDVERITVEEVKAFYDRYYVPSNATLVLVGDFDTRDAISKVHARFAGIPGGPGRPERQSVEVAQNGERRITVRRDAELTRLEILYRGAVAGQPADAALDVIRALLAGSRSARLTRRLEETDRTVTFATAWNDARRDPGLFWIWAEVKPGCDPAAVEAAIHEETAHLATEPVGEEELARAKKRLVANLVFGRAKAESRAEELGELATLADWRLAGDAPERILAVTAEEVRRTAVRVFEPSRRSVGFAAPTAAPARRSARAGGLGTPGVQVDPEVVHLENGLTLLVARDTTIPVLALSVSVDAGRRREAKPGLAHFTGNYLMEGAGGRDAMSLADAFASCGASVDTTGRGLTARCLSEDAAAVVPLVADVLRRPEFPEAELSKLRDRILSEIQAENDDPRTVARRAFDQEVYGPHPFARPERGTEESVAALSREDAVAHHRRFFVPGNTVIAAVSDRPTEEVVALLRESFADWRGEMPGFDPIPEVPEPHAARKEILRDTDQVNAFLGHRGIARDDPDYYPLLVMDYVLGMGPGFTDRLSRTIRDRDGLAYDVYASISSSAGLEPGTFHAFVGTSAPQGERAIAAILAEVRRIREEPVTEEEMADAKAYLTGAFVFGFETAEQLASRLVEMYRLRLGFDYPATYAKRVNAVTIEDVLRVARKHLDPERVVVVTVGPKRE